MFLVDSSTSRQFSSSSLMFSSVVRFAYFSVTRFVPSCVVRFESSSCVGRVSSSVLRLFLHGVFEPAVCLRCSVGTDGDDPVELSWSFPRALKGIWVELSSPVAAGVDRPGVLVAGRVDCPAPSVQDSRMNSNSRIVMNWHTSGSNPIETNGNGQGKEYACGQALTKAHLWSSSSAQRAIRLRATRAHFVDFSG